MMKFCKRKLLIIPLLIASILTLSGCDVALDLASNLYNENYESNTDSYQDDYLANLTENEVLILTHYNYDGEPYILINDGNAFINADDYRNAETFEIYSTLDDYGRTREAFALLSQETMPGPDEERESISHIKPAGFVNKKYDNIDNGGYLYNRCHLIGWQLSAENDNERNLITGTSYLNIEGMLDFENQVADYLYESPENKVLYRVTPIYQGLNLVCEGLLIEAISMEEDPVINFCVYCYNVQPGIDIDYETGESKYNE